MATALLPLTPLEEIRENLERHNTTFESLLRLIPAKYYIINDDPQDESKYQKNKKKQKAPKQEVKEASKKARKAKLDPDNQKSIVELQEEAAEAKRKNAALAANSTSPSKKRKRAEVEDEDEESDDSDAISLEFDEKPNPSARPLVDITPTPMPVGGSIVDLRNKLQDKIASFRKGRGIDDSEGMETKDSILEARRLKRAQLRENRRKETREKKRAKKEGKQKSASGNTSKPQLLVDEPRNASTSTLREDETRVKFSKLSIDASSSKPKLSKKLQMSTDPKQALAQLKARDARLGEMPAEKRAEVEERDRWAKAAARMDGEKVRDDEGRLKKAVKRAEKEKVRSKKEWDERKRNVAAGLAAKQKKRNDNIAARKKDHKGKSSVGGKKSKGRPGFEGKSFGGKKSNQSSSKR